MDPYTFQFPSFEESSTSSVSIFHGRSATSLRHLEIIGSYGYYTALVRAKHAMMKISPVA
jgi:hypothetical protein